MLMSRDTLAGGVEKRVEACPEFVEGVHEGDTKTGHREIEEIGPCARENFGKLAGPGCTKAPRVRRGFAEGRCRAQGGGMAAAV